MFTFKDILKTVSCFDCAYAANIGPKSFAAQIEIIFGGKNLNQHFWVSLIQK